MPKLTALRIPSEYEDTHIDIAHRYNISLPSLAIRLERASLSNSIFMAASHRSTSAAGSLLMMELAAPLHTRHRWRPELCEGRGQSRSPGRRALAGGVLRYH
jgi:hypothetical protein